LADPLTNHCWQREDACRQHVQGNGVKPSLQPFKKKINFKFADLVSHRAIWGLVTQEWLYLGNTTQKLNTF